MSTVFVRRASYHYDVLRPFVFDLMGQIDQGRIGKGARVLIKPNLLAPAPPDRAVITHPLIIRAAVEYCLYQGALPQVSDSPAMGNFGRVMREGGIDDALKGLDVACRPFQDSVSVDVGPPFHKIEIAADAMNADLVINLPKLKTHTQMFLTLGVKNLFGCIVGMKKPEWHFRTGIDRDKFAELLVRIAAAVRPAITIIDAILAMEGQGPGRRGVPREVGIIMAGNDVFALDAVVCGMLGVKRDDLPTNRLAKQLGFDSGEIAVDGDLPAIRDFALPEMTSLVFGPRKFHRFMRKHLVQRPVCDALLCRLCGECWRYCPAKAITPELRGLAFDYDKCIRCYCCIEVCPYGALSAKETRTGRAVRNILDR